jgi:hypothetical protein
MESGKVFLYLLSSLFLDVDLLPHPSPHLTHARSSIIDLEMQMS